MTTFPVAGIKYHDQNLQEGRVSSESQSGGVAHVSRKAQWQELEKDGHIVSVSWGAGGGGRMTFALFPFSQAIRVGLLSSANPS